MSEEQRRAADLTKVSAWLRGLEGGPAPVAVTAVASCQSPAHEGEASTWFHIDADPAEGAVRLRCVGCARFTYLLDSEARWTYPRAWLCSGCRQPIAEVVFGVGEKNGVALWLVVAVRCVNCGAFDGVSDLVPASGTTTDDLLEQLPTV